MILSQSTQSRELAKAANSNSRSVPGKMEDKEKPGQSSQSPEQYTVTPDRQTTAVKIINCFFSFLVFENKSFSVALAGLPGAVLLQPP